MKHMSININKRTHTIPDGATWSLYSVPDEILLYSDTTTTIAQEQTVRGIRLTFGCPIPENLADGEYRLEIEVEVDDKTYTSTEPYIVSNIDTYDDGTILTFHPILKWTPTMTGKAEILYRDEIVCRSKVIKNKPKKLALKLDRPKLEPCYLTVHNDSSYLNYRVYYINNSIASAIDELRKLIDLVNMQCRLDSLKFTDGDYLDFLEQGRARFNSMGQSTQFTMELASGPIRMWWLLCAKWYALRVKYLEEGLTSFSYGGAAVTLDIDVTSYIEGEASNIETQFDQMLAFKDQIAMNGIRGGTGQYILRNRALGSVGASIGPVTGGLPTFPRTY